MVSPGHSGWAGLLAPGSAMWGYGIVYPVYTANGIRQARHTISWLVWVPVQPRTDWLLSVWGSKREMVEFGETPQYDVTVPRSCAPVVML